MSQENVEIVRRYFETMDSVLERYWEAPDVPLSESPLVGEVFAQLEPEAEWNSFIREEPYRGREEIQAGIEDWLEAGENWRVALDDLTDAGDGQVLAFLRPSFRGKGSGITIGAPLYTLVTVRNGKLSRIADYTERTQALKAAGLRE
jgi:ketosteroid isomerase-like protein